MTEEQWMNCTSVPALCEFLTDSNAQGQRFPVPRATDRVVSFYVFACNQERRRKLPYMPQIDLSWAEEGTLNSSVRLGGWADPTTLLQDQVSDTARIGFIRDIFGNPFKQYEFSDVVQPGLENHTFFLPKVWCSPTVVKLAEAIYNTPTIVDCPTCHGTGDDKILYEVGAPPNVYQKFVKCPTCKGSKTRPGENFDPHQMAVLADALEESGCTEQALLDHARQTDIPHVHGCWLIDLILGKG